jgi:signal transduction histidine kinase
VIADTPPLDALIQLNYATVVGSLVSSLIHDLNNGLLVIGGSVELMEDGPLGEESRPRLERIRRQHDTMATRLRELSSVVKPEGRGVRADLRAVATEAAALRETALRRRGMTVRVDSDGSTAVVPVAPDRLLQIVLNLLLNAEAAVRDRLFEPFVTSAPAERAGLGLYVSRAMAGQVGGTLSIAEGSDGTNVTLGLPAA